MTAAASGLPTLPLTDGPASPSPFLRAWLVFLARVLLGLIFGMAGYWKTFELTPVGHYELYFEPFIESTWLPIWILWPSGVTIPIVEFVTGWLLVAGLRVRESLVAIGVILIVVTYGHLLQDPLYVLTGHVIPRFLLVLVVVVFHADDRFSIDAWWHRRRTGP